VGRGPKFWHEKRKNWANRATAGGGLKESEGAAIVKTTQPDDGRPLSQPRGRQTRTGDRHSGAMEARKEGQM